MTDRENEAFAEALGHKEADQLRAACFHRELASLSGASSWFRRQSRVAMRFWALRWRLVHQWEIERGQL